MSLNWLTLPFALCSAALAFFGAGYEDVGASLRLDAQGFPSAEAMDDDDKQIVDCLEHVSFC
jgi:hypothetical protein